MPCSVYESSVELAVGVLEPAPGISITSPLPPLRATGQTETRAFAVGVLENASLRVEICPELGGRVLSILDKASNTEVIARPHLLAPVAGGPRGVRLPYGLQIRLADGERPNAMGRVAMSLETPGEDEDSATIWVAETSFHGGLGFHAAYSLIGDEPRLRIEVRAQNRTLGPLAYNGGLQFPLAGGQLGLLVIPDGETILDGQVIDDNQAVVSRFESERSIRGRQVDTWAVNLVPLRHVPGSITVGNAAVAIALSDQDVRVRSLTSRSEHKLLLQTEAGQTFEAPVTLDPGRTLEIPLEDLPSRPVAVALMDERGNEIARTDQRLDPEVADLRRATFDAGGRAIGYIGLGIRALIERDYARAETALEQALLYNGDDPLAWWALGATRRLSGDEGERPETLNGHFLAPLEPVLRAEAFLSQSPVMGREPNPLIAPIAEIPEDLVEVACLLLEHGLPEQASRWIDEALRHHNIAMLRYLYADALLTGTRMDVEAAEQVRLAATGLVPPLPWRAVERAALERLAKRFPGDEALQRIASFAGSAKSA